MRHGAGMVPLSFGGHEFAAMPQGALFWPARRALLLADLHLEKASWFAMRGQMLPPYDSLATVADLTALVAATGARERGGSEVRERSCQRGHAGHGAVQVGEDVAEAGDECRGGLPAVPDRAALGGSGAGSRGGSGHRG